jgi:hypothetical protein
MKRRSGREQKKENIVRMMFRAGDEKRKLRDCLPRNEWHIRRVGCRRGRSRSNARLGRLVAGEEGWARARLGLGRYMEAQSGESSLHSGGAAAKAGAGCSGPAKSSSSPTMDSRSGHRLCSSTGQGCGTGKVTRWAKASAATRRNPRTRCCAGRNRGSSSIQRRGPARSVADLTCG